MERYELVEGTSSKFWEVEVSGADLTVRFGRIGTGGQTKTKTCADAAAAQREWEKLVKEKTGKGYALVTFGSAQAPSLAAAPAAAQVPAAPRAAPAKAPPAAVPAASAPAPVLAPAPTVQAAPQLLWPTGGFQWRREWLEELPFLRGVHAPTPAGLESLLATIPALEEGKYGFETRRLAEIAQQLGKSWTYWGENSGRFITEAALRQADPEYWLQLFAQAIAGGWREVAKGWAVQTCVALHGLPFAFDLALRVWRAHQATMRHGGSPLLIEALRGAVAAAPEDAYAETLRLADSLRGQDADCALACAYVFAHRADWCEAAIVAGGNDLDALLLECSMPPEQFLALLKKHPLYWPQLRPAALMQVKLHGEAALPGLSRALEIASSPREMAREVLAVFTAMRVPAMLPQLARHMDHGEARAALEELAREFPAAVLFCAIERTLETQDRTLEGWTVRLALRLSQALPTALAALPEAQRRRFESLLAALQRAEGDPQQLPPVLRDPPWLRKQRQQDLPLWAVQPLPCTERLEWDAAAIAKARHCEVSEYVGNMAKGERFPHQLGIQPAGEQRLLKGEPLLPGDVAHEGYSRALIEMAVAAPKETRLLLWNSYPADQWGLWYHYEDEARFFLAEYGVSALPGLVNLVRAAPDKGLPLCAEIDSPRLVEPMLRAFRNLKKSRDTAERWLRAHVRTALVEALPQAFREGPAAPRDDARFAIRWMAGNGMEAQVREVAQAYGPAMQQATEALLALDPLLALPARMPKLPSFFVPGAFRRPELHAGGALPAAALEHLGTMLAISRLDAPYAGLAQVKAACTPASLAEFAWDLFEAWIAAGAPSKEAWAFTALGLLGDDETARRLAPRIREWPGESAHARAVTGLDLLAAIGSDVALMHLNGIAGKVKFKALQDRAREKIAAVAEARGFTAEELADRLVPDLGLDEQGTVVLDFGARQFRVAFDETLRPFVRDVGGARLKDLPKPNKADDAALADAATERFKQMKKDAKAIASLQLLRLEMGMVARRRWSAADFQLFFLEHPLMRHLAARLVWGVYADGKLQQNFRVAEDWTLADARDERFTLAPDAVVGIPHVLEMPQEAQEAFGQLFGDYEIQQPFRQLGRETYALTPQEKGCPTLTRFAAKVVATGSVMGLVNRGWERGEAQDAGWVHQFHKRVGEELQVDLELDPGTVVGEMSYEPRQKVPEVTLRRPGTWDKDGLVNFGELDPILTSEVLRDLDLLAPAPEQP